MSGSVETTTKEQPSPTPAPSAVAPHIGSVLAQNVRKTVHKFTTREGWFGDYDYAWLCMPTLPTLKSQSARRLPPFYALHQDLPILLALSCGLQHALAMLAGLITPPIIFASSLNLDSAHQAYMVSASLIGCGALSPIISSSITTLETHPWFPFTGILSLVQMSRIRLYKNYYLGTGLLTVVGTSFATLSTANAVSVANEHLTLLCKLAHFRKRFLMPCMLMVHVPAPQQQMEL